MVEGASPPAASQAVQSSTPLVTSDALRGNAYGVSRANGVVRDTADEEVHTLAERASELALLHKQGTRGSIFAATLAEQVEDPAAREKIKAASSNVLLQVIGFTFAATFAGLTPFLQRKLMRPAEDGSGKMVTPFIGPTPYLVDYLATVVLGQVIAFFSLGMAGVKRCWNLREVLMFAPSQILLAPSEAMQVFVLTYLDGTSWRLVRQLKLPLTVVAVRVVLCRRGTSRTQWILIGAVTSAVCGYCLHSSGSHITGFSTTGFFLGLGCVMLTVGGCISGDYSYKNFHNPLYVQMVQGRISSFLIVLVMVCATCTRESTWHLFLFGGWSWRVCLFAIWIAGKDWAGAVVLKHLDSVWKALAGVLALGLAYLLDVTFSGKPADGVSIAFISCCMICILGFASSKADAARVKKLEIRRLEDKACV